MFFNYYYLGIIFICAMYTKWPMISFVKVKLEYPTYKKKYAAST